MQRQSNHISAQVWRAWFRDQIVISATYMFIHKLNELYLLLFSQPKLVLNYQPRRNGRLSWPNWLVGLPIHRLSPIQAPTSVTWIDID